MQKGVFYWLFALCQTIVGPFTFLTLRGKISLIDAPPHQMKALFNQELREFLKNRLKTIAGFKRKAMAVIALWFFLVAQPLFASTTGGVSVTFTGCPCTSGSYVSLVANLCNNSPVIQNVYGFRFKTPSFNGYAGYGYSPGFSVSGTAPAIYTQMLSPYEQLLSLNQCRTDYSFGANPVPAGKDGTPYDMQTLLKTGACNPIVMAPTPTPIASCAGVAAVTATAGYYSTACSHWAENGGADAGGFINNFSGETQIQVGIPSSCFTISGTSVQFNPTASMGGPMYMMSVAMGQEYFNVDMMQLLAQGGKEQFDGMVACGTTNPLFISTNTTGVAGLFSEESYTFVSRVQGFPQFFPYYSCISTQPDATTAILNCPNMGCSGGQPLYYYLSPTTGCSTTSYIGGNSAETANSVVVAALNLWELYDALSQSTNLCFKSSLEGSGDPLMATKFLASGYNQGLNSGWQNSLPTNSTLTCAGFPQASNYVCDVLTAYNAIESASNCSGAVSIYDAQITWANVQSFFWGDSAAPPCTMGTGGLLMHFSLTCAQETALYNALQCAFTTLSSHWGGSTISYRYDWLTLMRVAREYLSTINSPLAIPNSSDFNLFVTAHSTNATACGSTVETTFPNLSVTAPAIDSGVTNVCPPFNLTINATDSVSVSTAQWTLDGSWNTWNNFTGSGPNYTASLTAGTTGMPASGPVTVWVQVTNPCGNTTNQAIALNVQCSVPTATPTNTNTPTPTKTNTYTNTPTYTYTSTPTNTRTSTSTFTPTVSNTYTSTVTNTATKTYTSTFTNTFTATSTPTLANTATSTYTPSSTDTATPTYTRTMTFTPTTTLTATSTATATRTNTATLTYTPSSTSTLTPTITLTPTGTVPPTSTYTNSPTSTNTLSPTMTPTFTDTAVNTYTATSSFTPTSTATFTDTPVNTYTVTSTPTPTYTLLFTATSTYSFTPTATFTSTDTPVNTYTVTNTPTYTYTASFTSTQTPSFTPTSTSSTTWTPTATQTLTKTSTPTSSATPTYTSAPGDGFFISKNVFTQDQPVSIMVSTTQSPGIYGLTIFNSAGEHIKTLDHLYISAPYQKSYTWDGKNKFGSTCSSGVYVIYLTLPFKTVRARVIFLH